MKIMRFLLCISCCFTLMISTAFASESNTNLATKDFTADYTSSIYADNNGKETYGNSIGNTYQDTRTEEEKLEDSLKADAKDLEKKIQDIMDQLNSGGKFDGNILPELGDFIDQNKGNIGSTTLPNWTLKENPNLKDNFDMDAAYKFFLNWVQGLYNIPDIEVQPKEEPAVDSKNQGDSPNEEQTTPTDGIAVKEDESTFMAVRQVSYPIGAMAMYAEAQSKLKDNNQKPLEQKSDDKAVTPDITFQDVTVSTATAKPSVVNLPGMDWKSFFSDFRKSMLEQLGIKPGQTNPDLEDQFIQNPNISNKDDFLSDGFHEGTLPGTDITVKVPDNYDELYKQLLEYTNQLKDLNRIGAVINQYEIYQVENIDIQTVHTSIPTNEYRWVVTGPGGTIERYTDTPNVKVLFRSEGEYNAKVYNTRSVYRNNKVSGTKSEVWVISNGGYFDGLVIYRNDTKFESYVSEDIGPTIEEIELKKNGFTAMVKPSMLNKVQVIDENGNIRVASDGFTTERN